MRASERALRRLPAPVGRWLTTFIVVGAGCCGTVDAQVTTWNGSIDSNWSTDANWSSGVPDVFTDADIPSTANAPTTIGTVGASCRALAVQATATLDIASGFPLTIRAGATIDGTITGGLLRFDGPGSLQSTTSLPSIELDAAGTLLVTGANLHVTQDLTVTNGTFQTDVGTGLDVDGNTFADTGGNLNFDAGGNFGGDLIIVGMITTGDTLHMDGTGTLDVGGASIDSVEIVSAGTIDVDGLMDILGALNLTSGTLNVNAATSCASYSQAAGTLGLASSTLAVATSASFTGGALVLLSGTDPLDVEGDASFAATTVSTPPDIHCGGNWSSDAAFDPVAGEVRLDGAGPQTLAGPDVRFFDLTISGADVTGSVFIDVDGGLLVQGTMTVSVGLDVAANVLVDFGGGLNFDAGGSFGGDLIILGMITTTDTLTMTGTGVLDVGSSTLLDVIVDAPGQTVDFDGTALAISGTLTHVDGTLNLNNSTTDIGALVQTGGALRIEIGNTTSIAGSADFQGGSLQRSADGPVLDVASNVDFTSTSVVNPPRIECGGDWSADSGFQPTSETVSFDANGVQLVSMTPGASFFDLEIGETSDIQNALDLAVDGTVSLNGDFISAVPVVVVDLEIGLTGSLTTSALLTSTGTLTIDGLLATSATIDADGEVILNAGGTLDLGSSTHTFAGDTTFAGNLVDPMGMATLNFDTTTSSNLSAGPGVVLPDVIVSAAGTLRIPSNPSSNPLTVGRNFTMSSPPSGVLDLVGNGWLTVQAAASFMGGSLAQSSMLARLTFESDVDFNGTTVLAFSPDIHVAGDWTSNANFAPTTAGQLVLFDGTTHQLLTTSGGNFRDLEIEVGANVCSSSDPLVSEDLIIRDTLSIAGLLTVLGMTVIEDGGALVMTASCGPAPLGPAGSLDVNSLSVDANGALDLGAGEHSIGGNLTADGSFNATGTLRFNGGGTVQVADGLTLPNVVVEASGTVTFWELGIDPVTITGSLLHSAGTLRVRSNDVLRVEGFASMQGGTILQYPSAGQQRGTLRFEGGVAFSSLVIDPPYIECCSDWTSDFRFMPTSGSVTFDGVQALLVTTTAPALQFYDLTVDTNTEVIVDGPLHVNNSTILNGKLVPLANMTNEQGLTIALGGELSGMTQLDANGPISISAGGTLDLGNGSHSFAGNLIVNSQSTFVADGTLTFDDSGSVTLPSGTDLQQVVLQAPSNAAVRFAADTSAGEIHVVALDLCSGTLRIDPGDTLRVSGTASFSGGILGGLQANSLGTLDLEGATSFTGTDATLPPAILCSGSWSTDSHFSPTSNRVTFDGAPEQLIETSEMELSFHDLTLATTHSFAKTVHVAGALLVEQGHAVTMDADLEVDGVLTVDGDLALMQKLTVRGATTVNGSGDLDLTTGLHDFAGNFTVNAPGTLNASGTMRFNDEAPGQVTIRVADGVSLPALELDTGDRQANIYEGGSVPVVAASLLLRSGSLSVAQNDTLRVPGLARFEGGEFSVSGTGTLDLDGQVEFAGTLALTPPDILCSGDWSSDDLFTPTRGTLTFDGLGQLIETSEVEFRCHALTVDSNLLFTKPVRTLGLLEVEQNRSLAMQADLTVGGHTWVRGALSIGNDRFDASEAVTVFDLGLLELGGGTHDLRKGLSVNVDGLVMSSGIVQITEAGTLNLQGKNGLHDLWIDSTGIVSVNDSSPDGVVPLSGSFTLRNGELYPTVALRIADDAHFEGGEFFSNVAGPIEVAGDVTFSGTLVNGFAPDITCGGNWSSDESFLPTAGKVTFDGRGSPQLVSTTGQFHDLTVEDAFLQPMSSLVVDGKLVVETNGLLLLSQDLAVDETLTVAGWLSTNAMLDANGSVSVLAGGTLDLSTGDHTIAGSLTVDDLAASFVPGSSLAFDGTSTRIVDVQDGAQLTTVRVLSGTVKFKDTGMLNQRLLEVTGDLEHLGGVLQVEGNHTLRVAGQTLVDGGQFTDTLGTLDLDGGVNFQNTLVQTHPTIDCSGSWAADAGFVPTSGTVRFDGGTRVQTISHVSGRFHALQVVEGSELVLSEDLLVRGALALSGTLRTDAALTTEAAVIVQDMGRLIVAGTLDADGSVRVASGGGLELDEGTHAFASGLTVDPGGALASSGSLIFDDGGVVQIPAGVALPNVVLDAFPLEDVTFRNTTSTDPIELVGDLRQVAGTLCVAAGDTLHVHGDARFLGGMQDGGHRLFIDGDVRYEGTLVLQPPSMIRCGGSWRADASFQPQFGEVVLDGDSPTRLRALDVGSGLHFHTLTLSGGLRRIEDSFTLHASSIEIESDAELLVSGANTTLPAASVEVAGRLSVLNAGSLALGAAAQLTVEAGGRLKLVGAGSALPQPGPIGLGTLPSAPLVDFPPDGPPASIRGHLGGGYGLSIYGAVEAYNFAIEEPGPAGMLLDASAIIAAPPFDLRAGRFVRPSAQPGSVLLQLERPAPLELFGAVFEDPLGAGSFNVRITNGAPVTFLGATGNFAGEAFDDDPGEAFVHWQPLSLTSGELTANVIGGAVHLRWTFRAQSPERFVICRSESRAEPELRIAELPASGAYAQRWTDRQVAAGARYRYSLWLVAENDAVRRLAMVSVSLPPDSSLAAPMAHSEPGRILSVGPQGEFPTIQAAIDADGGTARTILVEAGHYPSFALRGLDAGSLRIVGQPDEMVQVDATRKPLLIRDVAREASVELSGLFIDGPPEGGSAVVLRECTGCVLLDELRVRGGPESVGIRIQTSDRIAIQDSLVHGAPALLLEQSSRAFVGRGRLDGVVRLVASSLMLTERNAALKLLEGAEVRELAGALPWIRGARFLSASQPLRLELEGTPGAAWMLCGAPTLGWRQRAQDEGVELARPAARRLLATGTFPASGFLELSRLQLEPRTTAVYQLGVRTEKGRGLRWSNAAVVSRARE